MFAFSSFDKGPNDSAVLHKPQSGPNVESKMNIILTFPAVGVLLKRTIMNVIL